jgi:hypothetical protein
MEETGDKEDIFVICVSSCGRSRDRPGSRVGSSAVMCPPYC